METSQNSVQSECESDGFALDVNEVTQLLGVTRTRVSQLTTAGVLPAERKKVGIRNRLFYKRSDVLNYQHSFFNRHSTGHLKAPHASTHSSELSDGRVGASFQLSQDSTLGHRAPRPLTLALTDAENALTEHGVSVALNTIRKRLDQLASRPRVTAAWQSNESKIFESIDALFDALKQIDSQLLQSQALQQISQSEIASLKKTLYQLNQKISTQVQKSGLQPAQLATKQTDAGVFSEGLLRRSRLNSARFRSTVKKRFS